MKNNRVKNILEIVLILALIYTIYRYWGTGETIVFKVFGIVKPFIFGAMIAYVVNIIMVKYENILSRVINKEKHKGRLRAISMILSYFSLFLVIILLMIIIIPELISSLQVLMVSSPKAFIYIADKIESNEMIMNLLKNFNLQEPIDESLMGKIGEYVQRIFSGIFNISVGILSSMTMAFSAMINLFMSFIFSFYVLAGKEQLRYQVSTLMKTYLPNTSKKIFYVFETLDNSFKNFFVSQTLDATILGILCFIGMSILRLPYSSTVSIIVGFTALIPIIGAYVGITVGTIMILTVSLPSAIIFLIFLLTLQQIENNLIYPRIVGTSVGVPGIWVLVAVSIGGGIFGILGALVSVPIFAAIYKIIKTDVAARNSLEK